MDQPVLPSDQAYRSDTALQSAQRRITEVEHENAQLRLRWGWAVRASLGLFFLLPFLDQRLFQREPREPVPAIVHTTTFINPGRAPEPGTPCQGVSPIEYLEHQNLPWWDHHFRFMSWRNFDCAEQIYNEHGPNESCRPFCWARHVQFAPIVSQSTSYSIKLLH